MIRGYIYYSVGDDSIEEAKRSIESLRYFSHDIAVTVFTNRPASFRLYGVDTVSVPNEYSKITRIQSMLDTPYDETFYIDSDTLFIDNADDIFGYLDSGNMCLSLSNLTSTDNLLIPENFPFYNAGIIGYRLDAETRAILSEWKFRMAQLLEANPKVKDEPPFREIVFSRGYGITLLPSQYNYRPSNLSLLQLPVGTRIVHCHSDFLSQISKNNTPSHS
ncbi:hypothetical protein HGB24_02705 [Candidatus Saccharibacteria bacterium]|nr:hypothetical protein [Candidatus Saccharibacteria bacterium]